MPTPRDFEEQIARMRRDRPPLTQVQPVNPQRLQDAGPQLDALWRIALDDCERNIVNVDGVRYFGAGTHFDVRVYTRDIAISGLLGLNRLYPDIMHESLLHTRRVRWELGFGIAAGYELEDTVDVPWEEIAPDERTMMERYHTNSYARRTDDVIWIWAMADLFEQNPTFADWTWLLNEGTRFFERFYQPFFDGSDGLYRGQSCFVDIHFTQCKAGGYPQDWSIADCIMCKAASTNALYLAACRCLAQAAERCGETAPARSWGERAEALQSAMHSAFITADGHVAYLKDRWGRLDTRRHALGEAWFVEHGVVTGAEARAALAGYPVEERGVAMYAPFLGMASAYHDNASWPFVDTWYCRAVERAGCGDQTLRNVGMLAHACQEGFHEVVAWQGHVVTGSPHQLWSAAAFTDVCRRAGLWA
ncbi:MAG: hypothetical protein ACOCXJ_09190 [Planctomycetota bacterium]